MALTDLPKELREHIARAKGYLQKEDIPATLEAMSLALRTVGMLAQKPPAVALEQQINAILAQINVLPQLQPLLDPQATGMNKNLTYSYGKEGALATVLREFGKILLEKQKKSLLTDSTLAKQRLQELLDKAQSAYTKKKWGTGNSFMQRAATEFIEQSTIVLHIGQLLMQVHQSLAASKVFVLGLTKHPQEKELYTAAIEALLFCQEYAEAEKVFQKALYEFGEHPKTLARMAHMYALWGKDAEAKECAKRALRLDPQEELAQEVLAHSIA